MTNNTGHQVTLAQVALRAGVSRTTASAALNGTGRLSEHTREHVRAVAKRMGYRSNPQARALRLGQAPILGILLRRHLSLLPGLVETGFWPGLMFALTEELTAAGVGVLTVTDTAVDSMRHLPVDAVLTVTDDPTSDAAVRDLPGSIPRIVAGDPQAHGQFSTVGHDHVMVVRDVMDHLRDQGAKHPGLLVNRHVTSIARHPTTTGYRSWCSDHGVAPQIIEVDLSESPTTQLERAFAAGCDAVYALTGDNQAALAAITEHGQRRVPSDVLVVGFGESLLDGLTSPPISTVSLMGPECGHVVAKLALRVMKGGDHEHVLLPYRLTPRASSLRHHQA